MHEINTNEHGYWTDDKTIWGIPVSSAFFIRHGRNIDIRDVDIRFREAEGRPAFALAETEAVEIDRVKIGNRKYREDDRIYMKGNEIY